MRHRPPGANPVGFSLSRLSALLIWATVIGACQSLPCPFQPECKVEVDWTVIHPDGRRVGSGRQRNSVEAGRLDGAWGMIATAAAHGGAEGVVSLLEGAGDRLRNGPSKR